jgi:hypothetical protein
MKGRLLVLIFLIYLIYLIALFTFSEKFSKIRINSIEELDSLVNTTEFEDYDLEFEEEKFIRTLFKGDECLLSKYKTKNVLKKINSSTDISVDQNLRFILGKCNPVLLVPGIYATKLILEIKCKDLYFFERETNYKYMRLFCGNLVCEDVFIESEEHPLFISLKDKAFGILDLKAHRDPYSSCLGYFMNFFQNENECPVFSNISMCYYSKYIKVDFYGGTSHTLDDSRCGVGGIQNIIQTGKKILDNAISKAIPKTKSFKTLSDELINRGYKEGFSFAGLPNDYRRFLATNNFGTSIFRLQINKLYQNTGKPVVIIAHSYGTLLTLANLVKEGNEDLIPKIKKFVAIAPPFAGSSKLLDIYLHGMNEFGKTINIMGKELVLTNYNKFGQNMMYQSIPILKELRPLPIAAKIFTDQKYKTLGDALRERIQFEDSCKNLKSCESNSTPKFDSLFKGYFPTFSDQECKYSMMGAKLDGPYTMNRKCFTNIYNVGECPTIVTKSSPYASDNPYGDHIENYCGKKGFNFYYQGECDSNNKNCLDRIYLEKGPYVYENTKEMDYLINRYNIKFADDIDGKYMSYGDFPTKEQISEFNRVALNYHSQISLIKDLPPPPVDTDIVYSTFVKTVSALAVYEKDFTAESYMYKKGGDGTVPSWSSLLTGFKWIYDKKDKNLKQKYKLVEYCSRLSQNGQYQFNPKIEQNFIALGCSCLKSNTLYKKSIENCMHDSMINDDVLVDYIMSVVDDPKVTDDLTNEKILAVKNYNSDRDYEKICNNELYDILHNNK